MTPFAKVIDSKLYCLNEVTLAWVEITEGPQA